MKPKKLFCVLYALLLALVALAIAAGALLVIEAL